MGPAMQHGGYHAGVVRPPNTPTPPRCQRSFNQLQGIKLEERQCGVRGEHYTHAADENLGSAGRERSKVVIGALNMGGLVRRNVAVRRGADWALKVDFPSPDGVFYIRNSSGNSEATYILLASRNLIFS